MANGKTNTIIIRDETSGGSGSSKNKVTKKDFDENGTLQPKRTSIGNVRKGRPRTGKAVEPNRYRRIYNSTLNKITGGVWERSDRFFRGTNGLLEYGNTVGINILGQFGFNAIYNAFDREYQALKKQAEERNTKDILRIRTGDIRIGNDYEVTRNFFTGRIHYKSNR